MTATFHVGDAIEVMSKLPEKSVDLILTSPPFLALRSYLPADHESKHLEGGSQATPGMYIDWLIDVVEACDRVLAPHGSLCFELGDTYAGSGGAGGDYNENGLREGQPRFRQGYDRRDGRVTMQQDDYEAPLPVGKSGGAGWPLAKSLSLIPELFRLTLVYGINPLTGRTTERWRLRNVVRWVRPNPPVGALGDKFRPATSELMVFCKSAKRYFDLDAVRTPLQYPDTVPTVGPALKASLTKGNTSQLGDPMYQNPAGAPPLDWWKIPAIEAAQFRKPCEHGRYDAHHSDHWENPYVCPGGEFVANFSEAPLDWWNIPPGGFSGAHYAVFPPELCIKPIKAMCPERVCKVCGEPSKRIVEKSERYREIRERVGDFNTYFGPNDPGTGNNGNSRAAQLGKLTSAEYITTGFTDCGHDDWRPGLVLDPFGGSGTTALVATGHGRDCILIDLDERNFDLALERVGPFILERAG